MESSYRGRSDAVLFLATQWVRAAEPVVTWSSWWGSWVAWAAPRAPPTSGPQLIVSWCLHWPSPAYWQAASLTWASVVTSGLPKRPALWRPAAGQNWTHLPSWTPVPAPLWSPAEPFLWFYAAAAAGSVEPSVWPSWPEGTVSLGSVEKIWQHSLPPRRFREHSRQLPRLLSVSKETIRKIDLNQACSSVCIGPNAKTHYKFIVSMEQDSMEMQYPNTISWQCEIWVKKKTPKSGFAIGSIKIESNQ